MYKLVNLSINLLLFFLYLYYIKTSYTFLFFKSCKIAIFNSAKLLHIRNSTDLYYRLFKLLLLYSTLTSTLINFTTNTLKYY